MAHKSIYSKKLLFIGSGNIASAVACGLVNSKATDASNITVYNRNENKFKRFSDLGINTTTDLVQAISDAEVVFLAVKPNVVSTVLKQILELNINLNEKLFVSFAASVSVSYISDIIGANVSVIRTMPSTPILIGEGVLTVARNDTISPAVFKEFCALMSNIAYVAVVNEEQMNSIISVQGSSPAYVYLFVKAMLDSAIKQGMDEKTALALILKTIKGAISMVEKSGESLEQLIKNVASPKGTTLAALCSFESDDFCGAVDRAMRACTKRADEISSEL